MPNRIDLTGQRFGRLIVIKETNKRLFNGSIVWKCLCDCGNIREVTSNSLRKGNSTSCGCKQREAAIKSGRSKRSPALVGKRFGRLVVVGDSGESKNYGKAHTKSAVWECMCDCGSQVFIQSSKLKNGETQSCGCLRRELTRDSMKSLKKNNLDEYFEGTEISHLRKANKVWASNTSGVRGVQFRKGKWFSTITFKGKSYYLGSYTNIEDAAKVRKQAEERIFGEFLDWYDEFKKNSKSENSAESCGKDAVLTHMV